MFFSTEEDKRVFHEGNLDPVFVTRSCLIIFISLELVINILRLYFTDLTYDCINVTSKGVIQMQSTYIKVVEEKELNKNSS